MADGPGVRGGQRRQREVEVQSEGILNDSRRSDCLHLQNEVGYSVPDCSPSLPPLVSLL